MSADTPRIRDALPDLRAQYQRLLERLEANEHEFRRLARSVWRVQEDERRRLARELHDGIGQNLTALKNRLVQLGERLPPREQAQLDAAIALCSETLDDTRQLSRLLRPPILDDLGLEPALRWLGRSIGEAGGPQVTLEIDPLPPLDGDQRTLLFRVAQEALNNATKHARAHHVLLRLSTHDTHLLMQVIDDGIGCDPVRALASGGSGLGGLRERLRLHSGSFQLRSAPGEGTCVQARLPLRADS